MKLGAVVSAGCGLVLLATGCGHQTAMPDHLAGRRVGAMAERRLEAENPRMAVGTMACPDLRLRRGASVRCVRTTRLSGGRVVKVAGTVAVRSLTAGGRLHVVMDDHVEEFGVDGHELATSLRQRYAERRGRVPGDVLCPYLRGAPRTTVTCRAKVDGAWHRLRVAVRRVDPASFRTTYAWRVVDAD